jgi:hypothetical protein
MGVTRAVPHGTWRLLVGELRGRGTAMGRDFVDWAVRALVDGHDAPALRVLAGLDLDGVPSAFAAADQFRLALGELGIAAPPDDELIRRYVSDVAQQIVDGELAPQDAVARLHREVLTPFAHPADLMAWCFLWEGLHPAGYASLEGEPLDSAVREYARAWLGQGGVD